MSHCCPLDEDIVYFPAIEAIRSKFINAQEWGRPLNLVQGHQSRIVKYSQGQTTRVVKLLHIEEVMTNREFYRISSGPTLRRGEALEELK